MAKFTKIMIPVFVFIACIILDICLGAWLFTLVPLNPWAKLIKLGLGVGLGCLTIGFIILITFVVGLIVEKIVDR